MTKKQKSENSTTNNINTGGGNVNDTIKGDYAEGDIIKLITNIGNESIVRKSLKNLARHLGAGIIIGLIAIAVSQICVYIISNFNITSRIGQFFGAFLITAYCKGRPTNSNIWSFVIFPIVAWFAYFIIATPLEKIFGTSLAGNAITYPISFGVVCALIAGFVGTKSRN